MFLFVNDEVIRPANRHELSGKWELDITIACSGRRHNSMKEIGLEIKTIS